MQKHYIIGDVHGEYETLLALIERLPKDAKVIFVGDLIDRGLQSAEVVKLVRTSGYECVMGNHEQEMVEVGISIANELLENEVVDVTHDWFTFGGIETLVSYGLLSKYKDGFQFVRDVKGIEQFKDDITWMKKLPLYLEVDTKHHSRKKVVVSHSNITKVWHLRDDEKKVEKFKDIVLWTRDLEPLDEVNIFNIYGHSPIQNGAREEKNYINLDTGCCFSIEEGYGVLTAYCVETGEIIIKVKA